MRPSITVVGSLNMDFVAQVAALPLPGETVMGSGFRTIPGGKGANQAVAARKLGSAVAFIGRIGADDFGKGAERALSGHGLDLSLIRKDEDGATAVEYGLIIALIAAVIVVVVAALGTKITDAFQKVVNAIP